MTPNKSLKDVALPLDSKYLVFSKGVMFFEYFING
ncbi:hypothetical protein SAMN06297164_3575 [Nitrosomonas ureae]|uniref:Uncharacterized protein n=1 Tax=Nitrosomonas ureae TaxID=44577 RepID=A0A286ALJ2_9PROT|nr:hypothetical protein SAMN06297164_3575 [Nitrosomonas ureae]